MSDKGYEVFTDVDASEQAARLAQFLDTVRVFPHALESRSRAYGRLKLRAGQRVLDAGCGLGDDVRELARLVSPGGEAVGVDSSEALLAEAERRNVPGAEATFMRADVASLPFEDASFDAYRAERLHQHLPEPEAAIAEAARVLKPGGRIAITDQDWESLLVASDDRNLTRRLANAFCDSLANGWSGRQLPGQLHAAGFEVETEIVPTVIPGGPRVRATLLEPIAEAGVRADAVSRPEADAWLAEQDRRMDDGRFFLAFVFVLASGTRR